MSSFRRTKLAYYAYLGAHLHRYVTLTLSSRAIDGCVIFSAAEVSGYDNSFSIECFCCLLLRVFVIMVIYTLPFILAVLLFRMQSYNIFFKNANNYSLFCTIVPKNLQMSINFRTFAHSITKSQKFLWQTTKRLSSRWLA